jgi:hypothetical protein
MSYPSQNTQSTPTTLANMASVPARGTAATQGSAEFQQLPDRPFSAFGSIIQFRDAQRMATMLAHSSIVPEAYRGDEHIGDCVIALEIANRIGASVLAVMQNLYLVQGKLGRSSQFLISCVNATKRFSPIRYRMTGTHGEDSWGCIAWAIDRTGQPLKSPEVTIQMAKEEGWYFRDGSKWKSMSSPHSGGNRCVTIQSQQSQTSSCVRGHFWVKMNRGGSIIPSRRFGCILSEASNPI